MELRIRLYYERKHRHVNANLVCRKCGADKLLMLFDGDVCEECFSGYDLVNETAAWMDRLRTRVGELIKDGTQRKNIAEGIGFSPGRVGEFVNGRCDSMEVAEALEKWLDGHGANRRFTIARSSDMERVKQIRVETTNEIFRRGTTKRAVAKSLDLNENTMGSFLSWSTNSLRVADALEKWLASQEVAGVQ